ncbi:hypothetical protein N0V90_004804 [Kalmusia sp. IMI 367209]|nr:hypothetical protein N0V90_004804 [Kalmusia sp. IMI 367209]
MSTVEEQQKIIEKTCASYASLPLVPISQMQAQSSRDRPAKGRVWISRSSFPAPPDSGLKDALFEVIDRLSMPDHIIMAPEELAQADVGVEFIGTRNGASADESEPNVEEPEKLRLLEKETKSDIIILYMHGGALYPADSRAVTTRLAHLTGAIVASTSYRLCPQHTFPTPILDVLVAYSSLLYPPTAAAHRLPHKVPATKIVLAGDSAGANLALGLLKFLLELNKRPDPTILFHGQRITLPIPAGIAIASGWCDQTDCLPSWLNPNAVDILTPLQPALWPEYPSDAIWPSDPPREHPYTRAANLDHELVSPAAVRDWTGAPPMWFAVGEFERGRDGNTVVASQATRSGVPVTWTEWEGMCHEWMIWSAAKTEG